MKRSKDPIVRLGVRIEKLTQKEFFACGNDYEQMLFTMIGIRLIKEEILSFEACMELFDQLKKEKTRPQSDDLDLPDEV